MLNIGVYRALTVGGLGLSLACFAGFIVTAVNGNSKGMYNYGVMTIDTVLFLIGSMYWCAGSYPYHQEKELGRIALGQEDVAVSDTHESERDVLLHVTVTSAPTGAIIRSRPTSRQGSPTKSHERNVNGSPSKPTRHSKRLGQVQK
jgi:hypothetical protein